ncbi:MAG TPA: RHS repeat-associated core domain-containing protein, partial [Terriglobales bacterium]|nr:RHS repeat-associated core domain-containing protein [Terriglobales bacterium]
LFPGGSFSGSTTLAGGQAIDPTGINHPNSTQYSYNAMGLLTQVTEGQQVRKFNYDSLGRLASQTLPEKLNLGDTFTYTDFGAVATRTDARGVKATYTYDNLDRVSSIVYSDGTPTITYTYGAAGAPNFAAGRVTKITDGAGSESYQYDAMGRVITCTRVIGANTYVTSYSYTGDGRMASMTYPSGRVVTDQYDGIGRLMQVGTGGSSLLNISSYNAAGQALGFTYGNGTQATFTYNAQLQVASILYGSSTSPILSLSYDWGGATDDGVLMEVTDNANSARSTSYSYDQLRRLVQAQTVDLASANTWKLQFTYDRYGNRLTQTPAGGTASMPPNQVAVDPTTNRITTSGYSYDADGDVTAEGGHAYTYDAEHRLFQVDGITNSYAYDGSGQRVNRNGNYYIYAGGHVIAEYANGATAASPTTEYIYAHGKRVATIAAGATTYHYWDHTSIRSSANSTGDVVRTYGHYPFGETWYETGTVDKWKFTTYERDTESGLDYAMARFHSSRMGRFMSLDPWPATRHNPQSWNRYAYAQNNPISLVDPSGMDVCDDSPAEEDCGSGGAGSEDLGLDGSGPNNGTDPGDDGSGADAGGGPDNPPANSGSGGAQCGEDGTACDSQGNCIAGDCMPQNNGGNDGSAPSDGSNNQGDNDPNSQPGRDSGTDNPSQGTAGNTDNSNNQGNQQPGNGSSTDNGQSSWDPYWDNPSNPNTPNSQVTPQQQGTVDALQQVSNTVDDLKSRPVSAAGAALGVGGLVCYVTPCAEVVAGALAVGGAVASVWGWITGR